MPTFAYTYRPPQPALADAAKTYEAVKIAGGYNPATNTFTPLKLDDKDISYGGHDRPLVSGWAVFATIAEAMEAGIVEEDMWPTQLFANEESYGTFVRALHSYEECYKLIDPWWSALRTIACGGGDEEEGHSTAADLAERFNEVLGDLPEQWPKPTKKKAKRS